MPYALAEAKVIHYFYKCVSNGKKTFFYGLFCLFNEDPLLQRRVVRTETRKVVRVRGQYTRTGVPAEM
jgi:hypothetical protein